MARIDINADEKALIVACMQGEKERLQRLVSNSEQALADAVTPGSEQICKRMLASDRRALEELLDLWRKVWDA